MVVEGKGLAGEESVSIDSFFRNFVWVGEG